jgi:hypothetical protein
MSAQTWAYIIIHNFSIKPELHLNGASLMRSLGKSHLSESMRSSTALEDPSAASFLGVVVGEPSQSYWASMEAKKLFKPVDDEQDALEAIMNQMELFSDVLSDAKD